MTSVSELKLETLAGPGGRCLRLLQQSSGLRNQFRHFEGFHQVGYVIFLQERPLITLLDAMRESKQNMLLRLRAVLF